MPTATATTNQLPPEPRETLPSGLEGGAARGTEGPSEVQLQMAELNHDAEAKQVRQRAEAFVALFLANGRKLTDPNFITNLGGLTDPGLQALPAQLEQFYDQDGKPIWLAGFETAEPGRRAEQRTLAALVELFLKGHLSAPLLKTLVPGGLSYAQTNQERQRNPNVDEVAHFFPPQGKDSQARIQVYERLFSPDLEPRKAIYHEIGHALLVADGLLYNYTDFRTGASDHLGGVTPVSSEVSASEAPSAPRPTPPEQAALFGALGNPARHKPWETAYVGQLLDQLSGDQSAGLKKHLIEEMLAERLRLYLESDGSLGDFIRQRLIHSSLFARDLVSGSLGAGNTSEVSVGTDSSEVKEAQTTSHEPLTRLAQSLDALLGELTGAKTTDPRYLGMLEDFVTAKDADGSLPQPLQEPLKAFLTESYHLHARYSRLQGEPNQEAFRSLLEGGTIAFDQYPLESDWDDIELPSLATPPPLGHPGSKGKTFWQHLKDFFTDLATAFRA